MSANLETHVCSSHQLRLSRPYPYMPLDDEDTYHGVVADCPNGHTLRESQWGWESFTLTAIFRCGYCREDRVAQIDDEWGWNCASCAEWTPKPRPAS